MVAVGGNAAALTLPSDPAPMTPAPDTAIGDLRIEEVYAYYEGPRLFMAQNAAGQRFLVVHADTSGDEETWLYAPVSPDRIPLIRDGRIDLHDAFAKAENGGLWELRGDKLRWITSSDVPKDLLPDSGERLAVPELSASPQVSVTAEARKTKRDVLEAHLDVRGGGTTAPVRLVGAFLESIQEMADAIGQIVYDVFTARGPISASVRSKTQLVAFATRPGSFAISMASVNDLHLFDEPTTSRVLELLSDLLEASSSQESLREKLIAMKSRAVAKYRRMLEALIEHDTNLRIFWGSPQRGPLVLSLKLEDAIAALAIVRNVERDMADVVEMTGVLKAIDITNSRKFKLLDNIKGREVAGTVLDGAMPTAEHATVNEIYRAKLRVVREVSSSGVRKQWYYLEELHPAKAKEKTAVKPSRTPRA